MQLWIFGTAYFWTALWDFCLHNISQSYETSLRTLRMFRNNLQTLKSWTASLVRKCPYNRIYLYIRTYIRTYLCTCTCDDWAFVWPLRSRKYYIVPRLDYDNKINPYPHPPHLAIVRLSIIISFAWVAFRGGGVWERGFECNDHVLFGEALVRFAWRQSCDCIKRYTAINWVVLWKINSSFLIPYC